MDSAEAKFDLGKLIRLVLWGVGILAVYVSASCLWHLKAKPDWVEPASNIADPFGGFDDSAKTEIPKAIFNGCDLILYDFPTPYRKMTNPMRYRASPSRFPYFEKREDHWDEVTAYLYAMKEPSLLHREDGDENEYFRFLIIEGRFLLCFRFMFQADGECSVSTTWLDGKAEVDPGKIQFQETKALSKTEGVKLKREIGNPDFWDSPSDELEIENEHAASRRWVFELSTPSQHSVHRFFPMRRSKTIVPFYADPPPGSKEMDSLGSRMFHEFVGRLETKEIKWSQKWEANNTD